MIYEPLLLLFSVLKPSFAFIYGILLTIRIPNAFVFVLFLSLINGISQKITNSRRKQTLWIVHRQPIPSSYAHEIWWLWLWFFLNSILYIVMAPRPFSASIICFCFYIFIRFVFRCFFFFFTSRQHNFNISYYFHLLHPLNTK